MRKPISFYSIFEGLHKFRKQSLMPLSTAGCFEQKGLIAFESLIKLAMALGYTSENKNLFSAPKFDTMEELDLIRQKSNSKRAYAKHNKI